MVNTAEIRALLVTPDPWLVSNFISLCGELGIAAQKSATINIVPEELGQAKYEAVLVDFDTVPETLNILAGVRESRGNRNALVFAVATDTANRHQALRQGANFIFERPIDSNEIRRVLYAAYDLMARESRRYFRCTAELPALLGQGNAGTDLRCTTINISSNGMALRTPSSLQLGEIVQIALFLPGAGQAVRATGTVVWDDKHGKTGINFQCGIPRDQSELDAWLNTRFYDLLTPRRATL
jgi:c-di-GMP-binding flagellar brake protein YcgR